MQSLCDTSYGLVDVFPIEDRKSALREVSYLFFLFYFDQFLFHGLHDHIVFTEIMILGSL